MVSALEIKRRLSSEVAPQYTIPAQVLKEGVVAQRVSTQHSLSYSYIERNMSPNKVAEMRFDGKRWVLIAPHGGYTPTEHLMFMRWEPDYTPDPVSIPAQEGGGVMGISADLAREIAKRSYNRLVVWSFHWSPYSFGQEGYQSIPTMWHPSIFGVPEFTEGNPYISSVDIRELTHKERTSIRGGIYNRHFGRFLTDHSLNGHFSGDSSLLNRLFATDQVQVDFRGIRVPAIGSLEDMLRTPGFFDRFLQPLVASINRCADDVSETFTDFKPGNMRRRIEEAYLSHGEPEDEAIQVILGEITKTPNLLKKSERARRIQFLREKGYTDEFIGYLAYVSDRRLSDSGPAEQWKRGFAYTFALGQDTVTGQGFMAISVGVRNGPGGVVENVLGAKLVRPPNPLEREEMEKRKDVYQDIVGALGSSVIQTLRNCPVKDICTDFRRYGRRYDDPNCTLSGDSCLNNPEIWGHQYNRYLEARLDGRRPPVRINLQHL